MPQQPIPPMQQFPSTPVTSATPPSVQQSMVQQQPAQQSMVQEEPAQQTLDPYFNMEVLDEHNNPNKQKAQFFASTLMEKLGADTVYKMSPHQIAALSAYTFLKLS